ncbi:MAG: primosomal protein N' [Clostridia bacterium]|nr:primosomal protein N' [Clostridia bacterium]
MSDRIIALVGVENCTYSFDSLFSYNVPDCLKGFLKPGMRVLVPFGRGNVKRQGFVFSLENEKTQENCPELKDVFSVLDAKPLLNDELLSLALWIRQRTFCTYFTAAKAMLPGGMCLKTEKVYKLSPDFVDTDITEEEPLFLQIINYLKSKKGEVRESTILKSCGLSKNSFVLPKLEGKGYIESEISAFASVNDISVQHIALSAKYLSESESFRLTDKQKSVVDILTDIGSATLKELCYFSGVSSAVIKLLIDKGICETFEIQVSRTPVSEYFSADKPRVVLSKTQKRAFDILSGAYKKDKNKTALLYGVTGSGKTNVYLELIERVLSDGKSVIVLVPEISLTPQTFSLFRNRFGDNTAVLHSGLSMGERYDEWKRIKNGEAKVVVGTRSAVFAPVENLGLIIVDEEQEHTYKSEMSPRYNAKDVAKYRCAYNEALLVFASATPSVETYAKALDGQYVLAEMEERYGNSVLPEVHIVDITDKNSRSSFFAISDFLAGEIAVNLINREQTILLVNRRGYNTFVVCGECKHVITCPKCSISMTYHSANNRLMCHYCGHSTPYTEKCPLCGQNNIRYAGFGTQRIEQELKIRFPEAKVLRMDADTTSAKNSYEKALSSFANGEYDILIGTQMVAKGLDFPNVTLVGITGADRELYNDDFRSAERTFDLITQVVGRAGRGSRKGRAVIQTVSPDSEILSVAASQDYKSFYNNEIVMRKAMTYPPFCDICVIGFSGSDEDKVAFCSRQFFEAMVSANSEKYEKLKMIVLGPLAPKVSKINNTYRRRLIVKCKNNPLLRSFFDELLKEFLNKKEFVDVAVYVDINPETID